MKHLSLISKVILTAIIFVSTYDSIRCQEASSSKQIKIGNLSDCKKWFKTAIIDLKKNKNNFVATYCKLPFLSGSGGDGYYIYPTIDNPNDLLDLMDRFISECSEELGNVSNVSYTETYVSDSTLPFLCNSYDFRALNLDGTKVFPDAKPPYHGLIAEGETVYAISYKCGPFFEPYNVQISYELHVVFDKISQTYKFWAANSGM
jgi:hypothetical protein